METVGGLPAGCQRLILGGETLRAGTVVWDYDFEGLVIEEVRRVGHRYGGYAPAGGRRSAYFPVCCIC